MFTSILNLEQGLTILDGVVCCMSALGLGLIIAWFYRRLGSALTALLSHWHCCPLLCSLSS